MVFTSPASRDTQDRFLRSYAFVGLVLLVAFLPGFLLKLGTERFHPLALRFSPKPDGSLEVRSAGTPPRPRTSVTALRVNDGPWLPPGSLAVSRDLLSFPVNTQLTYRVRQGQESSEIRGEVGERNVPLTRILSSAIRAGVALALALAGAALVVAGGDRRSLLGGAALVGFGSLFGADFLEPSLVQIRDPGARNFVTLLWQAYPHLCAPGLLLAFLQVFPGPIRLSPLARVVPSFFFWAGLGLTVLLSSAQVPGLLESWMPIAGQAFLIRIVGVLKPATLAAAALYAGVPIFLQIRLYRKLGLPAVDRRRAHILGWIFLGSVVPCLFVVSAQAALMLASGRQVLGRLALSMAYLPLLLVPPALFYVLSKHDFPTFRLFVRRTALFSFGEKTIRLVSLIPLLGLGLFLYRNRERGLGELISANPWPFAIAGAAALAGLLYRDRARRSLEGVFFHDRENARRLMGELAEKSRAAKDPASLEQLLSGEIVRALHAESVALFVRDRSSHMFVCPSRSLPTLDVDSVLVGAAGTRGVLELDPADRKSPLGSLPEIERHWVEESHARLLLPLSGADGNVIGLLTVGENLSELPWDKEDKSLLVAAAASGALALENSLLRSSGGAGAGVGRQAATHAEEDLARSCHLCSQIFSAALGPLCPKDQVPLTVADVPHVLAGKYRFERRIGSGGMGVVYLARDLSLGRFVAVKTLPKVSPEAAMRLRREARATARVLHPNLAVIFAAETWHGTPMLILEYLEGGTLAPRIARGPIPIESVVAWGIALSGALEAAHANGVLHRDIKPSNIGFTASGEPKLLDFGLASLLEEPEFLAAIESTILGQDQLETTELKPMTASGRIVGTLPYLAPEAILGESPQVSFDLWSLALTLYEATTGRNPFFEMPAEKTLNRILSQAPPAARSLRTGCPEELSTFFARALARRSAERFHSAREFHRALRRLAPALAV